MCHIVVGLYVVWCVLLPYNPAMSEHTVVAVVLTGDSITLNCTGTATDWRFLPPNYTPHDNTDKYICMYGRLLSEFEGKGFQITGNQTVGEVNLVITNATSDRAGKYVCQKENDVFNIYELIVLENIPVFRVTPMSDDRIILSTCSKTQYECKESCISTQNGEPLRRADNEFIGPNTCDIPQDQILVSCSVTYFSKDIPVLELINTRDSKVIETLCNTTELNATIYRNRLTCNATLNATMDLDGVQFIWQTNQSTQKQYNCTTEPIKILYSIDGTRFNHQTAQLYDKLNCTANCSHPCSYKWTWSEKSDQGVYKYEECTKEVIANRTGSYRCEAVCQMGKYLCEVTVMHVEVSPSTQSTVSQNDGHPRTFMQNGQSTLMITVGDKANAGSKMSVSIVATIFTMCRLLDRVYRE